MKANDRARLTSALRDHVAKIAADLRAKMRAPGAVRVAAEQLHKDERVAEDFEVWTDLLSRRASVLWVLKSVYVRVLEDRGLLAPGRLLDPEAQQLFERLAPNLGETAFLRWIYRDLASARGGLPELFSPQPAEVTLPSDELSRSLIAFWRHRDADTGAVWSFAEERFEGELMGDLYQELDPVVKDRFALCQTPDFVRAFILDRTLTPAIETFGADEVRLLDPACGSGHFLIDGIKRLVAATAAKHPDWDRPRLVTHALDRVVGIDLNDYACALARTRLIMTAAELAGVTKLADAAHFHPHVYWADGLEQVERDEEKPSLQYALFEKIEEKPRATLTRSDVRAALKKVFEKRFHAVVANPPYVTEKDVARKEYHREKVGKKQRYVSAYREYSLGSPFTERCFQLVEADGYVGIITGNNFMKREFGKPLIEKVFPTIDLTLIVDTSQAHIPFHGTSTALVFGRHRRPSAPCIRVVMGKRGESTTPEDPSKGRVWTSILEGWHTTGFENDYVSVSELASAMLAKHPWSIGGGGAAELRERLERVSDTRLGKEAEIGTGAVTREDEVYLIGRGAAHRLGIPAEQIRPLVEGNSVRDWAIVDPVDAIWPYDSTTLSVVDGPASSAVANCLWPWRSRLARRIAYGKTQLEHGLKWFEYSMFFVERFKTPLSIVFPVVASHNHFVLDRGGRVFKDVALMIKLRKSSSEDEYLAILGVLNSSTVSFWMRQVFHVKGGESTGKKRQSEVWSRRLHIDATKLGSTPIVNGSRDRVIRLTRRLDSLAHEYATVAAAKVLESEWEPATLNHVLREAGERRLNLRRHQIAAQEELDWTIYVAFGLAPPEELDALDAEEELASEHRPFAIRLARACAAGSAMNYWFDAMGVQAATELPDNYSLPLRQRLTRRLSLIDSDPILGLLEAPEHKRKWEATRWSDDVKSAALAWLADRVEAVLCQREKPLSMPHIVAAVQDDPRLLAVAGVYQGRPDIDLVGLVAEVLATESIPNHRFHLYTESGLAKLKAWEDIWELQRREEAGERISGELPSAPEYSQGSRGKSTDFLRTEYWHIRGKLDVPKERFIAFTEVPGRAGVEALYGWAGWTPSRRIKVILALDEDLEDAAVPLADRIALLDSAWRLLPSAAREDQAAAARLKAELQALVGPEGPSRELIEDWKRRFPPSSMRPTRTRPVANRDEEDESDSPGSIE